MVSVTTDWDEFFKLMRANTVQHAPLLDDEWPPIGLGDHDGLGREDLTPKAPYG